MGGGNDVGMRSNWKLKERNHKEVTWGKSKAGSKKNFPGGGL